MRFVTYNMDILRTLIYGGIPDHGCMHPTPSDNTGINPELKQNWGWHNEVKMGSEISILS